MEIYFASGNATKEISFALWGDGTLFDLTSSGSFFKQDDIERLDIDGVPLPSLEFYHWTGCFVAYVHAYAFDQDDQDD